MMRTLFGLIAVLAMAAVAAAAPAAETRHGSWATEDFGSYATAHTSNDSGSIFGMLCGSDCVFFLNLGHKCTQGNSYPAMISSDFGSHSLDLTCYVLDEDYVLMFAPPEDMADMFVDGGTVGFAVPLAGGEFGVSRFSLKGGAEAVDEVARITEKKDDKRQAALRDFTL